MPVDGSPTYVHKYSNRLRQKTVTVCVLYSQFHYEDQKYSRQFIGLILICHLDSKFGIDNLKAKKQKYRFGQKALLLM